MKAEESQKLKEGCLFIGLFFGFLFYEISKHWFFLTVALSSGVISIVWAIQRIQRALRDKQQAVTAAQIESQLYAQLLAAISAGNAERVREIVTERPQFVRVQTHDDPLEAAANAGHLPVLRALLDAGASAERLAALLDPKFDDRRFDDRSIEERRRLDLQRKTRELGWDEVVKELNSLRKAREDESRVARWANIRADKDEAAGPFRACPNCGGTRNGLTIFQCSCGKAYCDECSGGGLDSLPTCPVSPYHEGRKKIAKLNRK